MRRILFLLTICLTFQFTLAQSDSLKRKKVWLGPFVAATASKSDHPHFPPGYFDINYDSLVTSRLSYRMGLELKFRLSEHFGLLSGLVFDVKRMAYQGPGYYYFGMPDPSMIWSHVNTSYALGLPLRFDIRFSKKKLSPFITVGETSYYTFYQKYKNTYLSNYYPPSSSAQQYSYKINDPLHIRYAFQFGAGLSIKQNKTDYRVFAMYEVYRSRNYYHSHEWLRQFNPEFLYTHTFTLGFATYFGI